MVARHLQQVVEDSEPDLLQARGLQDLFAGVGVGDEELVHVRAIRRRLDLCAPDVQLQVLQCGDLQPHPRKLVKWQSLPTRLPPAVRKRKLGAKGKQSCSWLELCVLGNSAYSAGEPDKPSTGRLQCLHTQVCLCVRIHTLLTHRVQQLAQAVAKLHRDHRRKGVVLVVDLHHRLWHGARLCRRIIRHSSASVHGRAAGAGRRIAL